MAGRPTRLAAPRIPAAEQRSMNHRRVLVLLAIAVSFAGCALLFSYRLQSPTASVSLEAIPAWMQRESQAVRRTEAELRQLALSHEQLTREHERWVRQATELAADHERALRRLDTVTQELHQLYTAVAESRSVQLPQEWHQEKIETNAEPYGRIRDLLASLTEQEFPTVRTWYGNAWRELVTPFQTGRFPTKIQRDRLVHLLNEIREGEQQRLAVLQQTSTRLTAAATDSLSPLPGPALGATDKRPARTPLSPSNPKPSRVDFSPPRSRIEIVERNSFRSGNAASIMEFCLRLQIAPKVIPASTTDLCQ